ncbi:alpha/beta hydrolase [Caloramator sp. E03]|uniref:alpha/beta hydrolase n=1 Tax=Caloramator sp. E03 TaxID=2576307 RepID=UPI001A9A77FF|nr:alpha/beta hydrolase [Caloramator sp. E03]
MEKKMSQVEREKIIKIPLADTSYIKRKYLDIPYANNSNAQKLDIYLPDEGEGQFPVIVAIHGGAFAIGDKKDIQLNPQLNALKRGYAVVSVNYRLSGEALFPAGIMDLKAAIRWIKANADKYGFNPNKIAAWGGSAGGYYSVMLGATPMIKEFEDLTMGNSEYSCEIQAVVDWFGPTNFLKMDEQLAQAGLGPTDHNDEDSPESRLLGGKITEIPERVEYANPINYITKNMPPIFIQHGDKDHIVPFGQSILLVEKLKEVVGSERFYFETLNGADHADPAFENPENIEKVLNFLDKYLK